MHVHGATDNPCRAKRGVEFVKMNKVRVETCQTTRQTDM